MRNFKRVLGFTCGIVVALGAMIATVKMAYATEKPTASPVKYGVEEGVASYGEVVQRLLEYYEEN